MRFIQKLLLLVLLLCPCAYCSGQTSFSSVNGKGGYAVMKGSWIWGLDNGITLVPFGGYYQPSDKEEAEPYSTAKAGLQVYYDVSDATQVFLGGDYIPQRAGFERISYLLGFKTELCYHCGIFTHTYIQLGAGQVFYRITPYGDIYPRGFRTQTPLAVLQAGTDIGKFTLQVRYDKLIKYTHRPPEDMVSYWTEIPFMTAIVQGFVSDVSAAKVSYRTRWITPYGVFARYQYITDGKYMTAWGAGLSLHWRKTTLSGGLENFESDSEATRKNYFSFSASMEF